MFFRVKTKGPVKLCKFFSNLFHNALGIQVAGLLHSVTEVASQVFFFVVVARSVARSRTQVYISQRIAATCSAIAQQLVSAILRNFLLQHMRTSCLRSSGYETYPRLEVSPSQKMW